MQLENLPGLEETPATVMTVSNLAGARPDQIWTEQFWAKRYDHYLFLDATSITLFIHAAKNSKFKGLRNIKCIYSRCCLVLAY